MGDGYVKPSDCGITCAPGYNSKDNSIFKICKQDQGEFELIGCTPNVCHFPSNVEGYDMRNCMGDLSADKCQVSCSAPDYIGSPKVECLEHDGIFHIGGETCRPQSTPTTPSNGGDKTPTTKPNGGAVPSSTTAAPKKNKCFAPTNLDLAYDLSSCDVTGCSLDEKLRFGRHTRKEETHKKNIKRYRNNRKDEVAERNCHLYNGRGVHGCSDKLLNKFTHVTPCWRTSECLSSCLSTFKNEEQVQCYHSCLCRAGISPPCHSPACVNTAHLDVAKNPSGYVNRLRRHIKSKRTKKL
eukprot:g7984.t1